MLFFDNSHCLRCGSVLGYVASEAKLVALQLTEDGFARADGVPGVFRQCANILAARCNWLIDASDPSPLCISCRLTSVRPNDDEVDAIAAFAEAEAAKRRLLHQMSGLGLAVIDRAVDEERGVSFEFLSSRNQQVMTGHDDGVITLDLSESDDVHREFVRKQLGEAYRTILGHLRHEIGHYYWPRLVVDGGHVDAFRTLFGDERISYQEAMDQHYAQQDDVGQGDLAANSWVDCHVSQYATMHPWEDWAETFAHYLHIRAGLGTAVAYGVGLGDPSLAAARDTYSPDPDVAVGPTVQAWLGLTLALNAMSRSIGQGDLYPFVLSPVVIEKLDFVHRLIESARR